MSFNKRLKYFLVHTLMLSNKAAQALIDAGDVQLDGLPVFNNCLLPPEAEIKIKDEIKRAKKEFIYIKFNKPPGYQSSLGKQVNNNLAGFFTNGPALAIAGRLDQASEGLLLLSNNGKWVEQLCNPKFEKEKEYEVRLDNHPDEAFVEAFKNGVLIGTYLTKPCGCEIIGDKTIRVILKEGKNRQIRRMCAALGNKVIALKRSRIGGIMLENLEPGQSETFDGNISLQ